MDKMLIVNRKSIFLYKKIVYLKEKDIVNWTILNFNLKNNVYLFLFPK